MITWIYLLKHICLYNAALMTAYFPCVTFGQIAEILDEGQTSKTAAALKFYPLFLFFSFFFFSGVWGVARGEIYPFFLMLS